MRNMVSIRQVVVIAMSVYSVSVSTIAFYVFMDQSNLHKSSERMMDNEIAKQHLRNLAEGVLKLEATEVIQNDALYRNERKKNICPVYPSSLKGRLSVDATYEPTEEEAMAAAGDRVVEGCYEPPDCRSNQTIAIIIPFKNRQQHLITLLYHLHPILQRQSLRYCVFVPEQYDDGAFNKARVMNAGFLEIIQRERYDIDCLIFHDVDMLLEDDRNLYRCGDVPHHLSPAIDKFNYEVGYGTDFGGVGAVSVEQYIIANGHSNRFYGWGGEDSDMETRFNLNKILAVRNNVTFGRFKMIPHKHSWNFSPNSGLGSFFNANAKFAKHFAVPSEHMKKTDDSGLSTIKYSVKGVHRHKLYTKITIDVRTFLINNATSTFLGHTERVEAENPSITNDRLNTGKTHPDILGFGLVAVDEFPNYGCTYQHFPSKTVNMTFGIKANDTYKLSYNLKKAKSKCTELGRYCRSILETSPGIYSLRSSAYMHELILKYKLGRFPQKIVTETHNDVSVYAKICSKDVRYMQIFKKPIVLSEKDARDRNTQFKVEFDLQMFQAEDFKLYYKYSIYPAHKAISEDRETVMNTTFVIYDSLSVTYSNKVLLLDTEVRDTYETFLPDGYGSLDRVAEKQGILRLKTPPLQLRLLPGCYVCDSSVRDHNDGVHMKWKFWVEIRAETQTLENELLDKYLPKAKVGTTKLTEDLVNLYKKIWFLRGEMQMPDEVLRRIVLKQANELP